LAVALATLGGRKPPDTVSSQNSRNVYFFRQKKLARAESINSPKLVVIGGSSSLFSVRSEVVEGFVGLPTVNLGVQAGLGLDYILYDARRTLRPGDTAMLVLEYEHFMDNGKGSWSQADFTLHHELGWVLKIGPRKAMELMKLLSGPEMLGLLWRGVWSRRVDAAPFVTVLNERGDVIVNTRERAPEVAKHLAEYSSPMAFKGAVISEFSRTELGAFATWCRDQRVTIVAAAAPFMYFPGYQTNGFFEFDRAVRGLYESLGVEMLDAAGSNLFKRDEFFDTWYHLNRDAAGSYSEELSRGFARVPRYSASFEQGIDLSRPGLPRFIQSVDGLSMREPWGRWSDAKEVTWRFSRLPPQPLHMVVELQAFGSNLGRELTIRYGSQVRTVQLRSKIFEEIEVKFPRIENSLEMEWVIPEPQSPADLMVGSSDLRKLGVGLRKIRFVSEKP
jgi:hypothetical protein